MSGNIDLNSDVVLAGPDADNVAEQVSSVQNETLEKSRKSESKIELVADKVGGSEKDKSDSGEKKNEGFDLEVDIASVDRENDGKAGKLEDVMANSRVGDGEKEGNGKTGVVGASISVTGDVARVNDFGSSDSLHGGMNMEVKLANSNELFSKNGDGEVQVDRENDDMDVDLETKNFGGQTSHSDDDKVQESDEDSVSDMESEEDVKVVKKKVRVDTSKPEFKVSELVWAKVTSHPWWPGQVFDPSDATKKAKKYFKKDRYLIGYFGDQTFAWNDASKIKPFRLHFAQMVEQSKLEEFHDAIDCALDEVSRRVEFGLGCSCMPDYDIIKTQIIVNTGIREECSKRDGGDRFSTADCFEPLKLIEYIKAIAELPKDGVDRLEFTIAQSQLLAFNRWKGFSDLPEFQNLGTSLENDAAEIKPSTEVRHASSGAAEQAIVEVKSDEQNNLRSKRKKVHENTKGVTNKKEKSLADLLAERRSSSGKSRPDSKAATSKKRKSVITISDDKELKHSKSSPVPADKVIKYGKKTPISDAKAVKHSKSPVSEVQSKRTFRVGDSILRVASQLSGSGGILKSTNTASKGKSSSGKPESKKLFLVEDSIPNEMLLQLYFVSKAPLKPFPSLELMIGFFTKFRDFVCPSSVDLHEDEQSSLEHDCTEREDRKTESSISKQAEDVSGDEAMNDSVSEEQSSPGKQKEVENSVSTEDETAKNNSQPAISSDPGQNTDRQTAEADQRNEYDDAKPTALVLNFTNLDSVPSETKLNKIFSQYGLLMESQTEVLKKSRRAKVVFHKSADAEAAFSSAGKYSIFGPSLVSYRLKYMPSKSSKSRNAENRCKTDSSASVEGNAT